MSDMFEKANASVNSVFLEIMEKHFPELSGFSFGLMFRKKIKKSGGGVTLAEVCLPSKLMSFFAKNEAGNPYDYLMIFDEMAWACGREMDKVRIMRHELRHVFVDDKGNPKLIKHDFEDFHAEVDLNKDDPMWAAKLAEVTVAAYAQVKDGQNDPRINPENASEVAPSEPRQVQIEAAIKPEVKTGSCKITKILEPGNGKMSKAAESDNQPKESALPKDWVKKTSQKAASGIMSKAVEKQVSAFGLEVTDESSEPEKAIPPELMEDEKAMSLNDLARKRGLLPSN